jgi:hypothetical protein
MPSSLQQASQGCDDDQDMDDADDSLPVNFKGKVSKSRTKNVNNVSINQVIAFFIQCLYPFVERSQILSGCTKCSDVTNTN